MHLEESRKGPGVTRGWEERLEDRQQGLFPWEALSMPVAWAKEAGESVSDSAFQKSCERQWDGKWQGASEL